MTRRWSGDGLQFETPWGGQTWSLRLEGDPPGLYESRGTAGPLLGLDGLAAAGRRGERALSSATLIGCECRGDRVSATFAPPGWGELTARATWILREWDAVDLELEISARSVGELRAIEVLTISRLGPSEQSSPRLVIVPRDARCASLSYDGRESSVSNLVTQPPRSPDTPATWSRPFPGNAGANYVEFAHPHDESRWIDPGGDTIRHAFFGYDLERGVVLRGRLRGAWIPPERLDDAVEAFLREPPPLTT